MKRIHSRLRASRGAWQLCLIVSFVLLQKIYSILSRTNPKLSTLKPETILDSTFIQRIQSSGY